jgi:hypothetical protein
MSFKYGELVIYEDPESNNKACIGKIISCINEKYTLLMQTGVGGTRHQIHESEIKELKLTPSK